MTTYLSKYIPCGICSKPAKFVTEWLYDGGECYLCESHNELYLDKMQKHEPIDAYPKVFRVHEQAISEMKKEYKEIKAQS